MSETCKGLHNFIISPTTGKSVCNLSDFAITHLGNFSELETEVKIWRN